MEQYGDELLRTAYLLLKDRHAAEEAVMDTFAQAHAKIAQLREPDKLKGWLLRIVVNRCRMKMRTWSWRRLIPFASIEALPEEEHAPDPEALYLAEARNERLSDAILALDYKYREVITLHYYSGLKVAEIAVQLGCNENTVKARLSRGRLKLKRRLEEDGDASGAEAY